MLPYPYVITCVTRSSQRFEVSGAAKIEHHHCLTELSTSFTTQNTEQDFLITHFVQPGSIRIITGVLLFYFIS
jgi:hypothetical protein